MTVRQLEQTLTSKELTEWMAYYQIEPFGEDLIHYAIGQVAAVIANVHRDPKKTQPFRSSDFIHWQKTEKEDQRTKLAAQVSAGMKAILGRQQRAKAPPPSPRVKGGGSKSKTKPPR